MTKYLSYVVTCKKMKCGRKSGEWFCGGGVTCYKLFLECKYSYKNVAWYIEFRINKLQVISLGFWGA